ncbi:cytidylyltransferase domain-containing protein [Nitrosopumilus sp.]|uniref:cytidylyltransferase domain-containing protein n=1 Tax=Nitrosopumilus sp. TaxID=2024843 RepID=UPI003D09F571
MMKVDNENTVLSFLLNQLKNSKLIDKIVVATTELKEDDIIFDYVTNLNIECFRGDENDVLDRHFQCAKKYDFSSIVRIPSDKPLIDPEIVDSVIEKFISSNFHYITNFQPYTFPYGTEVEIMTFESLKRCWEEAKLPSEREHVTPYIYKNKEKFNIFNLEYGENLSHLRWEVDRIEDLELVKNLISIIKSRPILMKDIVEIWKQQPDIFLKNTKHNFDEGYQKSLKEDKNFLNHKRIN